MLRSWLGALLAATALTPLGLAQAVVVEGKNIRVEFDNAMRSRIVAVFDQTPKPMGPYAPSDDLRVSNANLPDYSVLDHNTESVGDKLGSGSRTIITATA